jgi:hypothetical protein
MQRGLRLYENYPLNNEIHDSIDQLLSKYPNIRTDDHIVIYLINWGCGFGSALTVFIQNMYYLKQLNEKLVILPHFSNNTANFKYHDNTLNNSFFIYFKKNIHVDLNGCQIYFCKSSVLYNFGFFQDCIPSLNNPLNKKYITSFAQDYKLHINTTAVDQIIKKIRTHNRPLIGIHMRSYAQKLVHHTEYVKIQIEDRILALKKKLDKKYHKYNVFISTDVIKYIKLAKKHFKKVYYLKFINRIDSEDDSIPLLNQYTGFKLGSDILCECYGLTQCDQIYLSLSNIQYIINIIDVNAQIHEY